MRENDKSVLVYSTFPSPEAAEVVGRELVEVHHVGAVGDGQSRGFARLPVEVGQVRADDGDE